MCDGRDASVGDWRVMADASVDDWCVMVDASVDDWCVMVDLSVDDCHVMFRIDKRIDGSEECSDGRDASVGDSWCGSYTTQGSWSTTRH